MTEVCESDKILIVIQQTVQSFFFLNPSPYFSPPARLEDET